MSSQFFQQIFWLQKVITYHWIHWRKIHHLSFGNEKNIFLIMDYRNKILRILVLFLYAIASGAAPSKLFNNGEQWSGTTKILFWIVSIYSSASEKTMNLNCCKFIKIVNSYQEQKVIVLPRYRSSLVNTMVLVEYILDFSIYVAMLKV